MQSDSVAASTSAASSCSSSPSALTSLASSLSLEKSIVKVNLTQLANEIKAQLTLEASASGAAAQPKDAALSSQAEFVYEVYQHLPWFQLKDLDEKNIKTIKINTPFMKKISGLTWQKIRALSVDEFKQLIVVKMAYTLSPPERHEIYRKLLIQHWKKCFISAPLEPTFVKALLWLSIIHASLPEDAKQWPANISSPLRSALQKLSTPPDELLHRKQVDNFLLPLNTSCFCSLIEAWQQVMLSQLNFEFRESFKSGLNAVFAAIREHVNTKQKIDFNTMIELLDKHCAPWRSHLVGGKILTGTSLLQKLDASSIEITESDFKGNQSQLLQLTDPDTGLQYLILLPNPQKAVLVNLQASSKLQTYLSQTIPHLIQFVRFVESEYTSLVFKLVDKNIPAVKSWHEECKNYKHSESKELQVIVKKGWRQTPQLLVDPSRVKPVADFFQLMRQIPCVLRAKGRNLAELLNDPTIRTLLMPHFEIIFWQILCATFRVNCFGANYVDYNLSNFVMDFAVKDGHIIPESINITVVDIFAAREYDKKGYLNIPPRDEASPGTFITIPPEMLAINFNEGGVVDAMRAEAFRIGVPLCQIITGIENLNIFEVEEAKFNSSISPLHHITNRFKVLCRELFPDLLPDPASIPSFSLMSLSPSRIISPSSPVSSARSPSSPIMLVPKPEPIAIKEYLKTRLAEIFKPAQSAHPGIANRIAAAIELLVELLAIHPQERLPFHQIFMHPFISEAKITNADDDAPAPRYDYYAEIYYGLFNALEAQNIFMIEAILKTYIVNSQGADTLITFTLTKKPEYIISVLLTLKDLNIVKKTYPIFFIMDEILTYHSHLAIATVKIILKNPRSKALLIEELSLILQGIAVKSSQVSPPILKEIYSLLFANAEIITTLKTKFSANPNRLYLLDMCANCVDFCINLPIQTPQIGVFKDSISLVGSGDGEQKREEKSAVKRQHEMRIAQELVVLTMGLIVGDSDFNHIANTILSELGHHREFFEKNKTPFGDNFLKILDELTNFTKQSGYVLKK